MSCDSEGDSIFGALMVFMAVACFAFLGFFAGCLVFSPKYSPAVAPCSEQPVIQSEGKPVSINGRAFWLPATKCYVCDNDAIRCFQ